MKNINSIDLWTEQYINQYECFNGAFVDGFEKDKIAFDRYKIIKNCNCIITNNNENINISNKHNAIVFYKDNETVRLVVLNRETNIEKCINVALRQYIDDLELQDIYEKFNITFSTIDLNEQPVYNNVDKSKEIDVGSCDRWNLLYNMLKGSYTESQTSYGNFETDKYEFLPNLYIKYELQTDEEKFIIEHKCGFMSILKTRIIPIQENSLITKN